MIVQKILRHLLGLKVVVGQYVAHEAQARWFAKAVGLVSGMVSMF
jgi:hypothetical protein